MLKPAADEENSARRLQQANKRPESVKMPTRRQESRLAGSNWGPAFKEVWISAKQPGRPSRPGKFLGSEGSTASQAAPLRVSDICVTLATTLLKFPRDTVLEA